MVRGPTPPGTGVIADAICRTAGNATSPTRAWPFLWNLSRRRPLEEPAGEQGVLDSVHADVHHHGARPHVIGRRSAPGRPMAATRMSASRVTAARSEVREWATVTVASAWSSRSAMGLPTMSLRPTTTARRPETVMPLRSRSSMMPAGVHATNRGRFCTRRPTLTAVKPSTSFAGIHELEDPRSCPPAAGSGSLHEDAVDVGPRVQGLDRRHDLLACGRSGQAYGLVMNSQVVAGLGLAADVHRRCGVVSDEDDAEPGPRTARRQGRDLVAQLLPDRLRYGRAVEQRRRHGRWTGEGSRPPKAASAAAT